MATARIGRGGTGRCRSNSSPVVEGRQPRVMWTPERQVIYERMKADYDANPSNPATLGGKWYKQIKFYADNVPYGPFDLNFLWPTFIYQVSGDTTYATKAYTLIENNFINIDDNLLSNWNRTRETIMEALMALDWLWPALTSTQQQTFLDRIGDYMDAALDGNTWTPPGYPVIDSDQLVAFYFAAVAFYHMFPTHERAAYWYNFADISGNFVGTGGVTATASNRTTTARNCIKYYVESIAAGGEWIESSEYNLGTAHLLVQGYDAMKTITGVDYFPEITAYLPELAKRQMASWAPDLESSYVWGDWEHPGITQQQGRNFEWLYLNSHLAGVLQGTTEGEQLQDLIIDLNTKWGSHSGGTGMGPAIRFGGLMAFNPYATTTARETTANKSFYASGMGVMLSKSGYTDSDTMIGFHAGNIPDDGKPLDHLITFLGDFQHYKDGEWKIIHPWVYGVQPYASFVTNTPLWCGVGTSFEYLRTQHNLQSAGFAYLCITAAGNTSGFLPYFDPPPIFLHEWTRSLMWFSGISDVLIVFDRAHVVEPTNMTRYGGNYQAIMNAQPSRKQFLFHVPLATPATYGSGAYTWTTAGGTAMKWTPILPATQTRLVLDMTDINSNNGLTDWNQVYEQPSERNFYQHRTYPTNVQDFDTFLNVFQIGSNPGAVTLLEDSGKVQGVHVVRPSQNDVVILFNSEASVALNSTSYHASHAAAIPLQRYRESGFTVSWTASTETGTTEVYLNDLNPSNSWTKNVDGAGAVALSEDSGGHVTFNVSGSGLHTLAVVGS